MFRCMFGRLLGAGTDDLDRHAIVHGVPLTLRELNRATLARQLLLRREPLRPVEGVRRILAIQAQEPASPYLALWNRLEHFDPDHLHRPPAAHEIAKASLMRITRHAVTAEGYPMP